MNFYYTSIEDILLLFRTQEQTAIVIEEQFYDTEMKKRTVFKMSFLSRLVVQYQTGALAIETHEYIKHAFSISLLRKTLKNDT